MGRLRTAAGLLTAALGLAACGEDARVEPLDALGLAAELHGRFDVERPGFGAADYPGFLEVDIPKSHAMILMAELKRKRHGMLPELADMTAAAGNWLLDHSDEDGDGVIGWGVPIAWDAYGDGSENPADTAYAISTAIAVEALLDWMEQDPAAPGARILQVVEASLQPFADPQMRSPAGLLPYSFIETDRQYDTFNPAAYLAGQLQRFSQITGDDALAEDLRSAADATVSALLEHRQVSRETGAWYWAYSVQENVSNDLPHASYIIDGLRQYVRHGGRLSEEIDLDAVLSHLAEFEAEPNGERAGYIRGWPLLQENIDRPARTYDLGMAMALACDAGLSPELWQRFMADLPKYATDDGAYLKYPAGSDFVEPLVVNEYEAYLYRGAIACAVVKGRQLTQSVISVTLSDPDTAPGAEASDSLVPFVRPDGAEGAVRLADGGFAVETEGSRLTFPANELPLAVFEGIEGHIALVRTMPDDQLLLKKVVAGGAAVESLLIHASEGTQPMFRAARLVGDTLLLVTYDNIAQNNFLHRFDVSGGNPSPFGDPLALPLLLDPAGGTYEMIPTVAILPAEDGIHIVGGTLDARLTEGSIEEKRLDGCLKVIEAVATPEGPAILCLTPEGTGAPYMVVAPGGLDVPEIDAAAVPHGLTFADEALSLSHARTLAEYQAVLVHDLERVQQNGWLEYGISNEEGRIPWSQIYYLNGFLDLLYLSERNGAMREVVGDLAPQIRRRLDLEIVLADEHWREGRYATRAFTIDRSKALFAVQTSRFLLLMDRYLTERPEPISLPGYRSLRQAVHCLESHIDVLARGKEPVHWLSGEGANLRWPKGSKFYFDGVAVPFNHQNEWAYSVLRTPASARCPAAGRAGVEIIEHFLRRIAPGGELPNNGAWDYWWGTAYDGWEEADGVSINKPEYGGDHIKAWISFRSIDTMSALAASEALNRRTREKLRASASHLVATGKLYPFVSYELARQGAPAVLERETALRYARMNSPWDLQSAAWAYLALANSVN